MKTLQKFLVFGFMAAVAISCKKDDEPNPSCDDLPLKISPVPFTILTDSVDSTSNTIQCNSKKVEFGPEWKEFISLDPQGSVVWPGAGLSYSSIKTGGYTPLSGDRKPITISVSLPTIGNSGITIQHPSLSAARTAMNQLLLQLYPSHATPAQIAWTQTKIYSEEHFKLAIGGNYGNLFMDINANFNYNSNQVKGRFLFQFTQVYYSVDCDAPNAGVQNFFHDIPSCAQTGGYSPVYVSSVKYGRKVFLMIETNQYDYSAIASIKADFDAFFSSGGFTVNTTLSNLINQQSIKGVIIGGSALPAIRVVNSPSKLNDYLIDGANFDLTSPGVPLSYTLRFMKDNSIASIVKYDKFNIRDCTIIPANTDTIVKFPSDINDLRLYRSGSGDQEFDGNGPKVTIKVSYSKRNNYTELWQVVKVTMKETQSDYTTGTRTYERKIWTAPAGKKIVKYTHELNNNTYSEHEYTDIDHQMDLHTFPASNFMESYKIMGDTNGDDVTSGSISNYEDWSHVHEMKFNGVKIVYQ